MEILNLTQHDSTPDQIAAGVIEPVRWESKNAVRILLTFEEIPTPLQMRERAWCLARIAVGHQVPAAMIGGAPFFMATLERALVSVGVQPLYAFSKREVVETPVGDGSVKKTHVFRHAGFVKGPEVPQRGERDEVPIGTLAG